MSYSYNEYYRTKWIKWGIIALVALILIITSVSTYNGLASAEQDVNGKWAQVQNVMQRRADVITNEVEVVKGYMKHEEKVFGDIANARAVIKSGASDINSKLAADEQLKSSVENLLNIIVEDYPELKAGEQFTKLQEQIEGSENRVSVERKRFIESVQVYNLKVKRFPGNIFARIMGYEPMEYYEASQEAQESPKVKF